MLFGIGGGWEGVNSVLFGIYGRPAGMLRKGREGGHSSQLFNKSLSASSSSRDRVTPLPIFW